MPHPVIRLFDLLEGTPPFCVAGLPPGATPRPLEAIEHDITAAADGGAAWLQLGDYEPMAHPELKDILWAVDESGARAKMLTGAPGLATPLLLETLRDGGLAQLTLVFWGASAATHDPIVGREGAFATLETVLQEAARLNNLLVTVRYVLRRDNLDEVGPLVAVVREDANRFELTRLASLTRDTQIIRQLGVPRKQAIVACQAMWEAARVTHLAATTIGFGTFPSLPMPRDTPVQPADKTLLEMLRSNVPVPSTANGSWITPESGDLTGLYAAVDAGGSLAQLGLQLAAYGCPPLDMPPCMGGRELDAPPTDGAACDDCPVVDRCAGVPEALDHVFDTKDVGPLPAWRGFGTEARIAVVAGFATDNILTLSTLPGLAGELRSLGAKVQFHSVWDGPFNPYDDTQTPFTNTPARISHAKRQGTALLSGLDLSGVDAVVTGGLDNALVLLENPTLSGDARIVIADFHMMSGIEGWHRKWLAAGTRSIDGDWWPDERIVVHALYPRYVRAYWRAGVPMKQIHWTPYPVHLPDFGAGVPVTEATTLFAGGDHQRDWTTLARAVDLLGEGGCRPITLHTTADTARPLVNRGLARLNEFHAAIQRSRFVVLPLVPDLRRPAGMSVISLALAAGRPVVASATPGTIDHLRHGWNAILVPPGRPKALARAIKRLDEDDALLERLAAGARRSARGLSSTAWARALIEGTAPATAFNESDDHAGPFYAWA